jgi:hypothetical protein
MAEAVKIIGGWAKRPGGVRRSLVRQAHRGGPKKDRLAVKRQNHSPTSRFFLAENGNWYKTDPAQPGVCVPVSFAERVKEAKQYPPFVEYAKRHNMTPEQYQTILDKHEKEYLKKERTSLLPFPLPDKYKNDGDSLLPRDALNAVKNYRILLLRFGPDRDEDEDQLKKATDVALGIRLAWSNEWDLELAEVPLSKDFRRPTDEDFARLEQWFLTAANTTKKEISSLEKLASGEKAKDGATAALAIVLSLVLIMIFELAVYVLPWVWLRDHANSYGIQVGVDVAVLAIMLGLFKPRWRKVLWVVVAFGVVLVHRPIEGVRIIMRPGQAGTSPSPWPRTLWTS